jgi:hypothetical protein
MFRLINSHLLAYSLQAKSQDAVHTLGSQCVYISEIFKPNHLPRKVKLAKIVTNLNGSITMCSQRNIILYSVR